MGVNSLPKTVTRQRHDCDLNPGPTAPESSTLTTRLPSHPFKCWNGIYASFSKAWKQLSVVQAAEMWPAVTDGLCVCLLDTTVNCAKTDEPIEMLFQAWFWVGLRSH